MSIILLRRRRLLIILSLSGLAVMLGFLVTRTPQVATPVLSYAVANRVIVIDPGHGGIDPGAIGRQNKVVEKKVNLAIATKLQQYIAGAGGLVVMTRTTDKDLSSGQGSFMERKREDLGARVKIATGAKADLYIAIHCNSEVSPRWRGAQIFYSRDSQESKLLARHIQHQIQAQIKNTDRKAKPGQYFVTDNTPMKAVLVEVGFLSNHDEERLLSSPEYQSRMAYAIFSGLANYYAGEPLPPQGE